MGSGAGRVSRAWRKLPPERRLAAGAALGLFVTLFLPWYQDTVILSATGRTAKLTLTSASITGWGAFSFVEAAVLLVAAGVLALLFMRAEGRAFHVPGGDGGVITAAGAWTCVLIVWRIFDKQGGQSNHGQYLTSTGIEWGIFLALAVAGLLVYAGSRIKLAHEPEPPLPGERPAPARAARAAGGDAGPPRSRPRPPRPVSAGAPWLEQEAPTAPAGPDQAAPALRSRPDEAPTLWTQPEEAPTERTPPDQPPTRRKPPDESPTRPLRPNGPPRGDRPSSAPNFEFPDLQEIEFEDPPTARLTRGDRRTGEAGDVVPGSVDQATTRIDPRRD